MNSVGKEETDYSNTIFYKIYCKDENVQDLYVGHTTNFVKRKYSHKRACHTEKDVSYSWKVYEYIRNNGGWNNWKMDIIAFHECCDQREARKMEQNYFESLHATLNSVEPFPKPIPKPVPISVPKIQKNKDQLDTAKGFYCEKCNYTTGKPSEWKKHLNTNKHKKTLNDTKDTEDTEDTTDPPEIIHKCRCGKIYQYHSGLSRHKKKCTYTISGTKDTQDTEEKTSGHSVQSNDKLIDYLMEDNKEMKTMMTEMCKQMQSMIEYIKCRECKENIKI
jgi:hypothetical protein